jgi:hypothetical protein
MSDNFFPIGRIPGALWRRLLEVDNNIIGLFICVFAIFDWLALYDGFDRTILFYSQGLYGLPSLNMLSIFASAVYLTFGGIILLSLGKPVSKYKTLLPNVVAVLAGFGVYIFVWTPSGSVLEVNIYIALSFILVGTTLVIMSFCFYGKHLQ